jgi:VanZ family protein
MAISHRQKLTIISLLIYWPGVFILSHIPIPQLVYKAQVSDKSIHFLAYLVLVFLLWFAISPNKKVNWRKAVVWWVLFVVIWYGVVDEVLQGYVGRNCDKMDFIADLVGTLAGLILFSFFTFWSVLLVVTGTIIFTLTNFIRANLDKLVPITNTMFHLFAYGFFTMLWIQYIHLFLPMKAPKPKWMIAALALPIGFLLTVKSFSVIFGKEFGVQDAIVAAAGITAVVATTYLIALCRKASGASHPADLSEFRSGFTQKSLH